MHLRWIDPSLLTVVLCLMIDKRPGATNKRCGLEEVTGSDDAVENPLVTWLVSDSSLSSKLMCVPCP